MSKETKFCINCGESIDVMSEICPKCGVRVKSVSILKNPGFAAILSFFIPGLGQIYNGKVSKGLLLIMISFVLVWTIILVIPIWIYSIYDAYKEAIKINELTLT